MASLAPHARADVKVPDVDGFASICAPSCLPPRARRAPGGVVDYYVIASLGSLLMGGLSGVAWVEREYHRAGPGGTGSAKAGGNCQASCRPRSRQRPRAFLRSSLIPTRASTLRSWAAEHVVVTWPTE